MEMGGVWKTFTTGSEDAGRLDHATGVGDAVVNAVLKLAGVLRGASERHPAWFEAF